MSKLLRVELKDDLADLVGGDVSTHTISLDEAYYEIEACPATWEALLADLGRYLAVARRVKKKRTRAKPAAQAAPPQPAKGPRLSNATVSKIRRDRAKGMPAKVVAEKWGVSQSYVYMLARRLHRKDVA